LTGTISRRDNYLRAAELRNPEWIPCRVIFLRQVWKKYREKLEDLVLKHPSVASPERPWSHQSGAPGKGNVDFDFLGVQYRGNREVDEWKCVWHYVKDGMTGQVVERPLGDWGNLDTYEPPDYPLWGPPDAGGRPIRRSWYQVEKSLRADREAGRLAAGTVPHGFMFMRLFFLRGFKNLMMDFVREDPRLDDLITMVLERNLKLIDRWLEVGPLDVVHFGDDLGMQNGLPMRPELFRKYLIPAYAEMFGRVREAGAHVHLHSDGYFLQIMDDLIKAGVTILNPQDRIHGIENLRRILKGNVCIDLDIDRQHLLPRGTVEEIHDHVGNAVADLGSANGGLMLHAGTAEDVPLSNIEALCQAMEAHQRHFSDAP
jgi:hypothetical protein